MPWLRREPDPPPDPTCVRCSKPVRPGTAAQYAGRAVHMRCLARDTALSVEEERRLLYVAMTRARDELHLLVPQRFYVHQQTPYGDKHVYAQRSRFITKAMLPLFDDMFWPAVKPASISGISPAAPRVDIGAQLKTMWQK